MRALLFLLPLLALAACAAEAPSAADLALGDRLADDVKADGVWGHALECKAIPSFPQLAHPEITVSLNGLTLELRDRTVGFRKAFPIGPGAIDAKAASSTFG